MSRGGAEGPHTAWAVHRQVSGAGRDQRVDRLDSPVEGYLAEVLAEVPAEPVVWELG